MMARGADSRRVEEHLEVLDVGSEAYVADGPSGGTVRRRSQSGEVGCLDLDEEPLERARGE